MTNPIHEDDQTVSYGTPLTIPGRVTVGDTDQDKTVQITIDPPEPGGSILGLDIPVDLGILAQRVVVEVRADDLRAALARDRMASDRAQRVDNVHTWRRLTACLRRDSGWFRACSAVD